MEASIHGKALRGIRAYLERQEFEIIEEGWAHGRNHVDFVARDDVELVFIACTVRENDGGGFEDEHLDRNAFERLAAACLVEHADEPESSVRFDIVSMLVLTKSEALLRHHRNALCAADSDLDRASSTVAPPADGGAPRDHLGAGEIGMGGLQPDGPVPVAEGAAAMVQPPLRVELAEGVAHADEDLGLDIQRVVRRKHPPYRKRCDPLEARQVCLRVGRGVVGEERVPVDRVAGEQMPPCGLPEAHVPGRVPGSVENFDHASAEVDDVTVMQHARRRPLEELVGADVVALRQVAAVHDHPADGPHVEGNPPESQPGSSSCA